MTYKKLLLYIKNLTLSEKVKSNILKVWLYKDNRVVIDLTYKGSTFAFDIIINNRELFDLYLVDRNDNINFLYKKNFNLKTRLATGVLLDNLEIALVNGIEDIFQSLDKIYQYDVSVVIPVYNREIIIEKCLDSLNKQTFDKKRYQIIFVDDNSVDKSIDKIKELAHKDLNYSILKRSVGSGNASAPRNEGIKYTKAKYVLFLDSDDYLSLDCLQKSYEFAEKNNSDVVYLKIGSDNEFPRNTPKRTFSKGSVGKADISEHHVLRSNGMCKLHRMSFLLKENILVDPTITISEDRLFSISVLARTKRISILADNFYIYITRHPGEQLTKRAVNLQIELHLYLSGCNQIFLSPLDFEYKNKLYNAWMMLAIERLRGIVRSKKFSYEQKYHFFQNILMYLNFNIYFINKNYIYKEFHNLLDSILEKNYRKFETLVIS